MLVSATACAERITPSKNYVTKKVNVGSFKTDAGILNYLNNKNVSI